MAQDSTTFDALETRSADARQAAQFAELREILTAARDSAPGWAARLDGVDLSSLTDPGALADLPVLRKTDLGGLQAGSPPFGGLTTKAPGDFPYLFMSPGPIHEPGGGTADWWRLGRFVHAAGVGAADRVQNCFAYHLTPAGHMFESGARAVGASVIPAGTGNTEAQVEAASRLGATAYAGTPDYLKVILDKADEMGRSLGITRAMVSGGALFPALRQGYADRGIACLQCYATADVGLIAYESPAMEGMILDEGAIVEIVTPGTGDPVPEGEVGEVVVTVLNGDYPLLRFATGDLSAMMPGQSPCGRTNARIKGWMGRADQTTKIKGMFVRPEQVATLVARLEGVARARVTVTRDGDMDAMRVQLETAALPDGADAAVADIFKLRGAIEAVAPGALPRDGKVIDDQRSYE